MRPEPDAAGGAHPNDTRWSRKQLRKGCTDCKDNAYWWEQRYPGWKFVRCVVPEPEAPGDEKEGWDADELRCYVVMVKRESAKSSHLTDKVPVFCVLTRAEERRRGIDQGAEATGAGGAASLWTGKKRLGGCDRAGDGLLRGRRPGMQAALQRRYLDGMPEERVVAKLHIGRTTYYHKELEALSTVAVYAAAAGLMPSQSAAPTAPEGATMTTAASGGNREELLGQRPAGHERQRNDRWEPQPVLACGETLQKLLRAKCPQ